MDRDAAATVFLEPHEHEAKVEKLPKTPKTRIKSALQTLQRQVDDRRAENRKIIMKTATEYLCCGFFRDLIRRSGY